MIVKVLTVACRFFVCLFFLNTNYLCKVMREERLAVHFLVNLNEVSIQSCVLPS